MPKASPIQPSFASGEFSPRVYGRVDNERYKTGLAKAENFLPTVQGPIIRRPGMKYVGNDVKDPSKPPAFIPFQFSQTQNYVLEFGDKYVRFYTNNTQIVLNTSVVYRQVYSTAFGSSFPTYAARTSTDLKVDETLNPAVVTVQTNSGILEIPTPYSYLDAPNIKWAQKEDTLFLFNTSYPTYKLIRNGNLYWDLQRVQTQDGPYLPLNSYGQTGDSGRFSIVMGPVTLASDGSTFPIRYNFATAGPVHTVSTVANNGAGGIRITTSSAIGHIFSNGDRVVVRSVGGVVEANNGTSTIASMSWPITRISATTFDLIGATINSGSVYTSGGTVCPALFQPLLSGTGFADTGRSVGLFGANAHRAWGKITDVLDMARVKIAISEMDSPASLANESFFTGSTAAIWQMEPYNFKHGFPSAGCFHQDRLALAGAPAFPQRIDLSQTADYSRFAPSNSSLIVTDNCAISFSLASEQLNRLLWLKPDTQGLLAGSVSSEWVIAPNNQATALTPTNVNARQTSFFGSHDADAVQTGNATLYIQKGQRRLRELNYFYQVDTYRSTDIAELSEHLMLPGLTKLANQRESLPIVWATTSEGKLRSMTYSRDDASLKVGWAPHTLGGQSDSSGTAPVVKAMSVIPSSDGTYDQLWCAVQRFVNGTSVCSVEYMSKVFDDNILQEDAICLDMAGTYDNPVTVTSISQAGSAIVTASNHGIVDGDLVLFKKVIGLNSSFVDTMGVTFNSNLVNGRIFRAGSTSTNAFFLQDVVNGSSYVDSRSYTPYFSGGEARKLVQTITGLTWLKNETVSVWADGKAHSNVTVNSGGFFTLDYKAAVVHVGYGYSSDGKTLRPEAGSADGTSIGKLRRPYRAAFMVHRSGELQIGPSFSKLTPIPYETFVPPQADVAVPLYSGLARESLESEHDFEGQVCFRMTGPAPGMIQTVTVCLEENDV